MNIFLDIDGVICTMRACIASGQRGCWMSAFDQTSMQFLNRICIEFPETKIIISSTWRHGKNREYFYVLFASAGYGQLANAIHKDWKTDDIVISKNQFRGYEIEKWLLDHDAIDDPYIILDDDSDMLDYQKDKFVRTDCHEGITSKNMRRIFELYGDVTKA